MTLAKLLRGGTSWSTTLQHDRDTCLFRLTTRPSSGSMEVVAAEGVAAEIYAKHRNSTQPESQQVCAVLGAVLEVVQAEGMQPTPTTLFAAVMSSLEKPETQASAQVCLAQPLHRYALHSLCT